MLIQTVTILHAVRYRRVRSSARLQQSFMKNKGRADSVRIIIPDDPDRFPPADFIQQDFHRTVHVLKQAGIIHILYGSLKIFADFFLFNNISVADNPGQHRAYAERFPYFCKVRPFGCDKPFCHILTPLYLQQHKMMSVHFFTQSIRKLTR